MFQFSLVVVSCIVFLLLSFFQYLYTKKLYRKLYISEEPLMIEFFPDSRSLVLHNVFLEVRAKVAAVSEEENKHIGMIGEILPLWKVCNRCLKSMILADLEEGVSMGHLDKTTHQVSDGLRHGVVIMYSAR
jgi:hypothetical protein